MVELRAEYGTAPITDEDELNQIMYAKRSSSGCGCTVGWFGLATAVLFAWKSITSQQPIIGKNGLLGTFSERTAYPSKLTVRDVDVDLSIAP